MINLMESQIPQNYQTGIYNEKGYELAPEHVDKIADVLFSGVTDCLADIKSKDIPVAFIFEQNNQDFIAGALVQFIPNEDDSTKAGSWSYVWTWYKEDIPSNARLIRATDIEMSVYFRGTGMRKYGLQWEDVNAINECCRYLLSKIKSWLDENAVDGEEVGVELKGVFQASVAVENGEKVFSIVPDGEIKKMIKDDSAIEV
jgi:hypothetical protein